MTFEWDPIKARSNLRKHRVSFDEAKTALLDPLARTALDPDHSPTEHRFITFGFSWRGRLLAVSHADRGKVIRLISALDLRRVAKERFMKKIRPEMDDWLRKEYERADFGEFVRGKFASTQLQFSELVNSLLACIGEEEGLTFTHHSTGNVTAGHVSGDWTYEMDKGNQITLRYWLNEFGSIEEQLSNSPCVNTERERSELQDILGKGIETLRNKIPQR